MELEVPETLMKFPPSILILEAPLNILALDGEGEFVAVSRID
jgi:hypothetical protein